MGICKFCGVEEDALDRRGASAHINRDGLCNACYQLLRAVRERPADVHLDDMQWFDSTCRSNMMNGRFVPVAQRRVLRETTPWRCKACGTQRVALRDSTYKNYCIDCATKIRRSRQMPPKEDRKSRQDKGTSRMAYRGPIIKGR